MPTLLDSGGNARKDEVYGTRTRCARCRRELVWMMTYRGGKPRPFDAEPLPIRYDVERIGWAPCTLTVAGRQRRCMAPRSLHPPQSRPMNVLTVHECLRRAA